jgi:hypothetical protein
MKTRWENIMRRTVRAAVAAVDAALDYTSEAPSTPDQQPTEQMEMPFELDSTGHLIAKLEWQHQQGHTEMCSCDRCIWLRRQLGKKGALHKVAPKFPRKVRSCQKKKSV